MATEWNEVIINCIHNAHKKETKLNALADQLVQNYLPSHHIGLILHSWDAPGAVLVVRSEDPVDSVHKCSSPTGATLAFKQFWAGAVGKQPAPEVHVTAIKMTNGRVDAVTVALGSNGGRDSIPRPYIAQSVDLLRMDLGKGHSSELRTKMKLSSNSAWTHGSFTLATASGLSHGRLIVKAGGSLTILGHYEGGITRQITHPVH